MTLLDPTKTTAGDICLAALQETGVIGEGQTPSGSMLQKVQARLQFMLNEWARKRWYVWHLVDYAKITTGVQSYTIGPGGDFDTNAGLSPFSSHFTPDFGPGTPLSSRPAKISSAFLRQITQAAPNTIDFPLEIITAREDYNRIALKSLTSFPTWLFYDSDWPLGKVYPWPIPQAGIYELHLSIYQVLPPMFASTNAVVNFPFEYFNAIVLNLALRIRPTFGVSTLPGDLLPGLAQSALQALGDANVQVATLVMPQGLVRNGIYNIFNDRFY